MHIQILREKCILQIPLSSDFLQIIGRKQIDGRKKSGLDSKGLSAIESIKLKFGQNFVRRLFFRGLRFFGVSESGHYAFFGEMFAWVVKFAGRLVACCLSLRMSESDCYFENIAFGSLKSPK